MIRQGKNNLIRFLFYFLFFVLYLLCLSSTTQEYPFLYSTEYFSKFFLKSKFLKYILEPLDFIQRSCFILDKDIKIRRGDGKYKKKILGTV